MKAKLFKIVIGLGLLFVFFFKAFMGHIGGELTNITYKALTPTTDYRSLEYLTEITNEANKSLPVKVDDDTLLESMSAKEGVVIYKYRVTNPSLQGEKSQVFVEAVRKHLIKHNCSQDRFFLEKGITLIFEYFNNIDIKMMVVGVINRDCLATDKEHESHVKSDDLSSLSDIINIESKEPDVAQKTIATNTTKCIFQNQGDCITPVKAMTKCIFQNQGDCIALANKPLVRKKPPKPAHKANVVITQEMVKTHERMYKRKTSGCNYKSVMTNADYIKCGITPPSQKAHSLRE